MLRSELQLPLDRLCPPLNAIPVTAPSPAGRIEQQQQRRMKQKFDKKRRVKHPSFTVSDWVRICRHNHSHKLRSLWSEPQQITAQLRLPPFCLTDGSLLHRIEDEPDLNLGTAFSAETNRRNENADIYVLLMMKYIEMELKKNGSDEAEEQKVKVKSIEDHMYELPENIRVNYGKTEMLSNQMLSGIPEVDLGIDAKIKNIIQTEEAKATLLAEQRNKKKDQGTSFVPTNIAVNYVQHNRFYHEDANAPQRHHRHKEEPKARPLRVGDTKKPVAPSPPNFRKGPNNQKATDDYHYEKFKKMNR
uniref:Chromosome 9 open reading frame 78 n=1 Tax=Cynoglossus semilaevis TaxID=244447 RepID=A0A3P8W9L1_CYNSE